MIRVAKILSGFLLTVAIFATLGPAVGAFAGSITIFSIDAVRNGLSPRILEAFTTVLGVSVLFAFFVGVKFALVAGAIVAAAGIFLRRNGIMIAVFAGVAACLVYWFAEYSSFASLANSLAITFLPICIIASLACWYVTRGIVRWARAETDFENKSPA